MINSCFMESKLPVGLKIFTTTITKYTDHMSHSNTPIFHWNQILPAVSSCKYYQHPSCFLKSCFLCHKHLSPNKDVYMYRGDQAFCSEECRSRQIYIDDVTQLEISTKKAINNFRRQSNHCRCHNHRTCKSMPSTPSYIFIIN